MLRAGLGGPAPEASLAGRLARLLPYAALLLAALLYLLDPPPLAAARNAFFDQLQVWHPRPGKRSDVTVIDIDEQSLQRLGQWPWPRTRLAEMVRRLRAAGASVIGFDMVFTEPDRSSPTAVLDLWPLTPRLRREIAALPDHDRSFADAIGETRVVLGYALQALPRTPMPPAAGFVVTGTGDPDAGLHRFGGRLGSLPLLEQAASGLGHFTVIEEPDAVVRRVPALAIAEGQRVPALALEMLRVARHAGPYRLETGSDGTLASVSLGELRIPTEADGQIWLHYQHLRAGAYLPAWRVIADDGALPRLEGQMVLVGSSAMLLHDNRVTPLGEQVPGVDIHRQLIEQVLDRQWLARPQWMLGVELLALLGGGLALIVVANRAQVWQLALLAVVLPVVAVAASVAAFVEAGLIADPVGPILAWASCLVLASLSRVFLSDLRQRWIRQAFSRFVSPNLVRHLVAHPEALELGGSRRECSFVFTDLEGFTPLIEHTPPRRAAGLINSYLDGMTAIVFRHDGTLVGIAGDALAVVFSAPVKQPDHAARALACALELDRFACGFAEMQAAAGQPFCRTRIGVHSGVVTVGSFGGSAMLEYRALGDPVNAAARLEAVNKTLGSRVCVSARTIEANPSACARPIGRLLLRGRDEPLQAYEPVAQPDPEYLQAFELMRSGSEEALARFEALALARPEDPLVKLHLHRLRAGRRDDLVDARG